MSFSHSRLTHIKRTDTTSNLAKEQRNIPHFWWAHMFVINFLDLLIVVRGGKVYRFTDGLLNLLLMIYLDTFLENHPSNFGF